MKGTFNFVKTPAVFMTLGIVILFCQCSKSENEGNGKLQLLHEVVPVTNQTEVSVTRSETPPPTDFSSYFVTLEGAQNKVLGFPSTAIVENLPEGDYTVSIASHQQMPAPDFGAAFYSGSEKVSVLGENLIPVNVKLGQKNAGLFLEYTRSLLMAELDYTPTVVHSGGTLVYSGDNSASTGYFPAGKVTITVPFAETPVDVDLQAGKIYKGILDYDTGTDGISITVTVETVDEPTDTDNFGVGNRVIW